MYKRQTQETLDFAYFGGIYRDCWMIAHNRVFITDPNYEAEVAGGGLFVSYDKVSRQSALVNLDVHIRNTSGKFVSGKVSYELYDRDNRLVLSTEKRLSVGNEHAAKVASRMTVSYTHLDVYKRQTL